jgi:hypothetical protein
MHLDWEKLVKRYVWHDERTPYFTRIRNLSATQARYELLAYCLFTGIFFGVLSVAALSGKLPHGNVAVVPLYAFSVTCTAVILGLLRQTWAALYCAAAPLGLLAYFAAFGFPPGLAELDHALLVFVMLAWAVYSLRVVSVVKAFPREW